MVKSKYGNFDVLQLDDYREKLHKKMFWLLLYKDPNTKDDYINVNFEKYFKSLMYELRGLNEILILPLGLVEMLSILEAAYLLTKETVFDYGLYRKFVLDAHNLLDKIQWNDSWDTR